ncbi:MAG: hypothetical protein HQRvContig01_59 [Haloquadratum phage sp.]|nr:MAG: hypothetical protein HQRvContig01_59 [Haloquadratum phage sp.]
MKYVNKYTIAGLTFLLFVGGLIAAFMFLPLPVFIDLMIALVGFVFGMGIFALVVYGIGPAVTVAGDMIGGLLWYIAAMSYGTYALVYDGTYSLEQTDGSVSDDESKWFRLARKPFIVGYDATQQVYQDVTPDETPKEVGNTVADGPEPTEGERANTNLYIPTDVEDPDDKLFVNPWDLLGQYQESASGDSAQAADQSATVEHGGDTSQSSPKVMLVGSVVMLMLGLITGFVVI